MKDKQKKKMAMFRQPTAEKVPAIPNAITIDDDETDDNVGLDTDDDDYDNESNKENVNPETALQAAPRVMTTPVRVLEEVGVLNQSFLGGVGENQAATDVSMLSVDTPPQSNRKTTAARRTTTMTTPARYISEDARKWTLPWRTGDTSAIQEVLDSSLLQASLESASTSSFLQAEETGEHQQQRLEKRAQSLWEHNQTLVKEIRFADQTCVELSQGKVFLDQLVESLQHQLQDKESVQQHLMEMGKKQTAELAELHSRLQLMESENASMAAELQEAKGQAEEAIKQQRLSQAEAAIVEEEGETMCQQLKEQHEIELKAAKDRIDHLAQSLNDLQHDLTQREEAESRLERKLIEQHGVVAKLTTEKRTLEREKTDNEALRKALKEIESTNQLYLADLEGARKELAAMTHEYESKLTVSATENSCLRDTIQHLESMLTADMFSQQASNEIDEMAEAYDKELQVARDEIDGIQDELHSLPDDDMIDVDTFLPSNKQRSKSPSVIHPALVSDEDCTEQPVTSDPQTPQKDASSNDDCTSDMDEIRRERDDLRLELARIKKARSPEGASPWRLTTDDSEHPRGRLDPDVVTRKLDPILESDLGKMEPSVRPVEEELEELTLLYEESLSRNRELDASLVRTTKSLKTARKELEQLRKREGQLADLEAKQQRLLKREKDVKKLRVEMKSTAEELKKETEQKLRVEMEKVQQAQEGRANQAKLAETLSVANAALREELEQSNKAVKDHTSENGLLRQRIEQLEGATNSLRAEQVLLQQKERELQELNGMNATLQKELSETKSAIQKLESRTTVLQRECTAFEEENEKVWVKVHEAQTLEQDLRGELSQARLQLDEENEANNVLRSRAEQTETTIAQLAKELSETHNECTRFESEAAAAKSRTQELEESIADASEVHRRHLEQTIKSVTTELERLFTERCQVLSNTVITRLASYNDRLNGLSGCMEVLRECLDFDVHEVESFAISTPSATFMATPSRDGGVVSHRNVTADFSVLHATIHNGASSFLDHEALLEQMEEARVPIDDGSTGLLSFDTQQEAMQVWTQPETHDSPFGALESQLSMMTDPNNTALIDRDIAQLQDAVSRCVGQSKERETRLRETISELQRVNKILNDDNASLRSDTAKSRRDLESAKEKIAQLDAQGKALLDLQAKAETAAERATNDAETFRAQLRGAESKLRTEVLESNTRFSRLDQTLKETCAELARAKEELNFLNGEIHRHETTNCSLQSTLAETRNDLRKRERELEVANQEISVQKAEAGMLSRASRTAGEESKLIKQSADTFEARVHDLERINSHLKGELDAATEKSQDLFGKLELEIARSKGLQEAKEHRISRLEANLRHCEGELASYKNRADVTSKEIVDAREEAIQALAGARQVQSTVDALKLQVSGLQASEGRLRQQIATSEGKVMTLSDEVRTKVGELVSSKDECERLQSELERLHAHAVSSKASLEEKLKLAKEEILSENKVRKELQSGLSEMLSEQKRSESMILQLQESVKDAHEDMEGLKVAYVTCNEQLAAAMEEVEQHKALLSQQSALLSSQATECEQAKSALEEYKGLPSQVIQLKSIIERQNVEGCAMEQQIREMGKAYEEAQQALKNNNQAAPMTALEARNSSLEQRCAKLREYIRQLTTKCEEWSESYEAQSKLLKKLRGTKG